MAGQSAGPLESASSRTEDADAFWLCRFTSSARSSLPSLCGAASRGRGEPGKHSDLHRRERFAVLLDRPLRRLIVRSPVALCEQASV